MLRSAGAFEQTVGWLQAAHLKAERKLPSREAHSAGRCTDHISALAAGGRLLSSSKSHAGSFTHPCWVAYLAGGRLKPLSTLGWGVGAHLGDLVQV